MTIRIDVMALDYATRAAEVVMREMGRKTYTGAGVEADARQRAAIDAGDGREATGVEDKRQRTMIEVTLKISGAR